MNTHHQAQKGEPISTTEKTEEEFPVTERAPTPQRFKPTEIPLDPRDHP